MLNKSIERSKTRQRHVFPSAEIPHLWFHKTQESARNANGSLYFSADTIYSYGSHFPIASHIWNKNRDAVLFTTKTYSVTTSSHCSAVRSAIPSTAAIFHVPNAHFGYSTSEDSNQHKDNLADYVSRIETAINKSARARSSWQKEYSHRSAVELQAECKAYCAFFRIQSPRLLRVPALDSDEMEVIRKREAQASAKKAEQTRIQREQQAEFERTKIERWRNGENVGYLYNVPVMLRVRTFGADESVAGEIGRVETSRGAQVPISHALRGLRFVRSVVKRGQAFQTNGRTFHLGHYKIDRIDADGTLTAGCHVISLAEIERIAPVLESLGVQS
jgi:hypothetical protein